MTPERWAEVDKLLDEALAREPEECAAFLDHACSGDTGLRREVESLLAAHRKAEEKFLKVPAIELAAQHIAAGSEPSLVGQSFSHYSVISILGVGGMGEVYLARDTSLDRKVALKFLPAQFTQDAGRIKRFEREAQAASALNHPNIITIYEIGQIENKHFIAAEYVDGQTLRELISSGRIQPKEVVEIASQICSALSAAHDAGIIHRDIKPENIMLRRDGYVKVLDFGLVKLTEQGGSAGRTSPSETDAGKTNPGAVLGTAKYMSPEQALGREVDRRTDIFSLGVTLYELLTGAPPFKGDRIAAVLDAVIHHQPIPLGQLRPELPAELERIVSRALEKDHELRYQSAADFRAELKLIQRELDSASHLSAALVNSSMTKAVPGWRAGWKLSAAAGLLVLLAIAAVVWRLTATKENQALSRESFNEMQITDFPGEELFPSLSPDGQTIVYARRSKEGDFDIWQQRVGGLTPINLTAKNRVDDIHPAYSPNGAFIVFRSEREGGGLFLMGATGESVRRLTSNFAYHPSWSPDGTEVIYTEESVDDPHSRVLFAQVLWAVNVNTLEKRRIAQRDIAQPAFSPSGHRIAYWGQREDARRDIWTMPAHGGEPVAVTDDAATDWNPVWSPDGKYIYFSSDRTGAMNLWRVPINERTGQTLGSPELVPTPSAFCQHVCFSKDGKRMAFVDKRYRYRLVGTPFDPARQSFNSSQDSTITEASWRINYPDVSPDGEMIVYNATVGNREDLYLVKTDDSALPQKLTDDDDKDRYPRWSPDGKRIAFYSNRAGSRWQIWLINRDGGTRQQVTAVTNGDSLFPVWSPQGDRLAYTLRKTNPAATALFTIDMTQSLPANGQPHPYDSDIRFWVRDWSADGKSLMGAWRANIEAPLFIKSYSLEKNQFEDISDSNGDPRIWLNDGRRLLAEQNGRILMIDSRTGASTEILSRLPYQIRRFTLPANQRTLYFGLDISEANVWVLSRK